MEVLELTVRKKAMVQGILGIVGAVGQLFLSSWLQEHTSGRFATGLGIVLFALGFGLGILGVWRLSVARNLRWDWCGMLALILMIVPGYPIVFLYVLVIISGIFGPLFSGR